MASVRPINVIIKGDYTDKDIKRAIRDLESLRKQGPGASKAMSGISREFKSLAAGAAAAVSIGAVVDQIRQMVTAAAQDQKSVVALSQAMSNLGIGDQTAQMEDFVKATMLATGTSDELIRQGLTRLTTATGDATQAQRLLNLALDISAAGYGDVVAISTALSKAATGNVTALKRLGVPLDENAVKAKDLSAIVDDLSGKFRGQASAAAKSYEGQIQRLTTAVGEAQETIGYALLDSVTQFSDAMGGTNGAVGAISAAGDEMAAFIKQATDGIDLIGKLAIAAGELAGGSETAAIRTQLWNRSLEALKDSSMRLLGGPIYMLGGAADALGVSTEKAATWVDRIQYDLQKQAAAARAASDASDDAADSNDAIAATANKATTAVERLRAQLDKASGNRSIARQRIQLQRMLAEGPTATGERTVMRNGKPVTEQYVTKQDRRLFRLDVADARAALGEDIANQPGMSDNAALKQFRLGRRDLRGLGLSPGQARRLLPTPDELNPALSAQQRVVAGQTGQQATTINYNFGDIIVRDAVEAQQQAKRLARLRALSNRGAQAALVGP